MKRKLTILITLAFIFNSFVISNQEKIKGWTLFVNGGNASSYKFSVVYDEFRKSKVGYLKSMDEVKNKSGLVYQNFIPTDYKNKRVRISAFIKSVNVDKWCNFWIRIDDKNHKKALKIKTLRKNSIKGNTDWKKYEFDLEFPEASADFSFGVILIGNGEIYFDDFAFEIIDINNDSNKKTSVY